MALADSYTSVSQPRRGCVAPCPFEWCAKWRNNFLSYSIFVLLSRGSDGPAKVPMSTSEFSCCFLTSLKKKTGVTYKVNTNTRQLFKHKFLHATCENTTEEGIELYEA